MVDPCGSSHRKKKWHEAGGSDQTIWGFGVYCIFIRIYCTKSLDFLVRTCCILYIFHMNIYDLVYCIFIGKMLVPLGWRAPSCLTPLLEPFKRGVPNKYPRDIRCI